MTFLLPAVWLLSILAVVPLLLFYLIRRRPLRRTVSTFLFWDELAPQTRASPLWRQLRRWVSWLLQVLFLMLLLFALAHPFNAARSRHAGQYIFVIDASPSMAAAAGNLNSWDQALNAVRREIAQLRSIDRAMVIVAGREPVLVQNWTSDRRLLRQQLNALSPGDVPADVEAALQLALNLTAPEANGSVHLFSDRVWPRPPLPETLNAIHLHPVATAGTNTGISHFSGRRSLSLPGDYALVVEVVHGGSDEWSGEIHLFRADRLVDIQQLTVPADTPWQHQWTGHSIAGRDYRVELVGADDALLQTDNTAAIQIDAVPELNVALIGTVDPFIVAALQASPATVHLTMTSAASPQAAGADLHIATMATPELQASSIPTLLIRPPQAGYWGTPEGRIEAPLIQSWQHDHPLLEHLDIHALLLASAMRYSPPADAETFIETVDGVPILFGRWDERSKWLVLAFDLADSNLVFRTAFPIFLSNLLQQLHTSAAVPVAALPGRTESQLQAVTATAEGGSPEPLRRIPAWAVLLHLPLWWWAVAAAAIWVVSEWLLYHRRVTE